MLHYSDDYRVASSSTMIFDSFLGLKESKDGKQRTKRDASFKNDFNPSLNMVSYVKSIMGLNLNQKLDLFDNFEKQPASQNFVQKLKDLFAKPLVDCISVAKETQDGNLLSSIRYEHTESVKSISTIISSILEEHLHYQIPLLSLFFKDLSIESTELITCLAPLSLPASFTTANDKYYQAVDCNHLQMVHTEDKMPLNLKELLSSTKANFIYLQSQIQNSLKQMESQIEVLATAAQGYHKVVQAYMSSCNMIQFLYGSFRGINTVIDWTGEDGSFVALDPLNLNKDGTKLLQFNRIFGTTAGQTVVFADAQQLISSIIAGYNVCVFAFVNSTADVLNLMKNNYLTRAVRSSFLTTQRSRFHSVVMVLVNGESTHRGRYLVDLTRCAKSDATQVITVNMQCLIVLHSLLLESVFVLKPPPEPPPSRTRPHCIALLPSRILTRSFFYKLADPHSTTLPSSFASILQIGFDHLVTWFVFKYCCNRITLDINILPPSSSSLPENYFLQLYVYFMKLQEASSMSIAHGYICPYTSTFLHRVHEGTRTLAANLFNHACLLSQLDFLLCLFCNMPPCEEAWLTLSKIAQLVPVMTLFAALYGHQPLAIVCYLLPCCVIVILKAQRLERPNELLLLKSDFTLLTIRMRSHNVATFHLEDKVNFNGGGNVMNLMGLSQQAQLKTPIKLHRPVDWGKETWWYIKGIEPKHRA
ncbi:putative minus-end-directed kinesin ATPase [Helianthus annuus]|nr:putative minus-end-directed kinesin ATPase [Helianthus annuus]